MHRTTGTIGMLSTSLSQNSSNYKQLGKVVSQVVSQVTTNHNEWPIDGGRAETGTELD